VSMVKAGETGGLLAEILDRLAGFLEASARLRKKVKSAMTYPVIVIIIAFAITTFLIVRVVPVFGEIFADFGAKLPAPTQFLIDLSNFVRGEWYVLFGGLAGVIFGVRAFLRSKRGKQIWDKWKLKLPVFGPLIHKICMSRFARTFAQLIRSGVPILEVLDIVGGSAGNHVIEQSIKSISEDVEKGDNLSVAMSKKSIFPPMLLRMVSAGEATGKIDNMLEKMADFWDEEIEAMLDALTSLIERMRNRKLAIAVANLGLIEKHRRGRDVFGLEGKSVGCAPKQFQDIRNILRCGGGVKAHQTNRRARTEHSDHNRLVIDRVHEH